MKKKLLFVIDSLECAGAEKSLVTLLNLLDFSKYEVDLLLFSYGGELEKLVPKAVNMVEPLPYTAFSALPLSKALLKTIRTFSWKMLMNRVLYTFKLRVFKADNITKARFFWESTSHSIERNDKKYDCAISYAQGVPTFYVADKVMAKQKLAWVNVSYKLKEKEKKFQEVKYHQFDRIIGVSEMTKKIFLTNYPFFSRKMNVIEDINNPILINEMANMNEGGYNDDFSGIRILTIGRLAKQKGYDLAIEACRKLKDSGISFRWYVLGKGPLEKEIKVTIKKYGLEKDFILLGVKPNPYPYIKNADVYVQTSKFEGFGLAIAEARMLNIPVVTTEFDAVYAQMKHEKNGLVVKMNALAVFEGIMKILNEKDLNEKIRAYLKNEKKGNLEEIEKIYDLIG